ncbi:MAG: hypothetical protein OEZ19_00055 [Paracoccaceae bacterium]|nr:hypothetical protein [Paracoccaceae bacterium]
MSITVSVGGLTAAQDALEKAMKDVQVESEEMLAVMLQAIAANTMPYVPVDTAALINSERRWTQMTKAGPVGHIEYGGQGTGARGTPVQEYAVYVHEGPQKNWQKPGASNLFLAKGVEDFIRDDLSRIITAYSQ